MSVSPLATVTIEALQRDDCPSMAAIYAQGMATGNATFETAVPSWAGWDAAHLRAHRLVARRADEVAGWIAALPVSSRCVYAGVVEHSVYVAESARGQGIGRLLLERFIDSTEA